MQNQSRIGCELRLDGLVDGSKHQTKSDWQEKEWKEERLGKTFDLVVNGCRCKVSVLQTTACVIGLFCDIGSRMVNGIIN